MGPRGKAYRLHDLELMLFAETSPGDTSQGAILVSPSGERADAVWLPKSQVEFDCPGFDNASDTPERVDVTVPGWLAVEKGLA